MRAVIAVALIALAGCSSAAGGSADDSSSADSGSADHSGSVDSDRSSSHSGPSSSAGVGRLVGHLGRYGGPLLPNGHMAMSDQPQPGGPVTATGAGTHRIYRATSDSAGRFAFSLPPGRYAVTSPGCQSLTVTVRADRTSTQPIICPVP
jgi:hypothetical protein